MAKESEKDSKKKSSDNKKKSSKKVKEVRGLSKKTEDQDIFILEDQDLNLVPQKKKARKIKPLFKILIILVLVLLVIVGVLLYIFNYLDEREQERIRREEQELVQTIEGHFNNYVEVTKDTSLYTCDENNSCTVKGIVYQNVELELEEMTIDKNTKYFYIPLLDSFVSYQDVEPIDELETFNERYKSYLPFNKNVVTNDEFTLYRDDKKVYTFKESMSFPIIINNHDGKYYVEYNNQLFYLLEDDVLKIVNSSNTKLKNAKSITTFCYHRVYDTDEKCTDIYICKKKSKFEQEMAYLKDNGYLTLTMEEMYLYLTGKLQVQKGVLVTFDDGYLMESAIEVLEEYNLNGNLFVITSRFKDFSIFKSPNLALHSHTHAMHTAGQCAGYGYQGGGILCLSKQKVLDDLKTSRNLLNDPIALAYPFYDYNTRAIELLEEAGFKMAFIGLGGTKGKASPGVNLYKIPRVTIWDTTSFSKWKGYLS